MKFITREDLARQVSRATGLAVSDIDVVLKEAFEAMAQNVAEGKCIQLRGLGTFEFRERLGRIRFNPKNVEDKVEVPAHFAPIFRISNHLKMAVRRLKADQVMATTFTFRKKK